MLIVSSKKKKYFLQWLYKVAEADGVIRPEEKEMLQIISRGLNVSREEESGDEYQELSREETIFFLREMYRIAIADMDLDTAEEKVIEEFCIIYSIGPELKEAVRKWALSLLTAEKKFSSFLEENLFKN